jgi:hypothetical protein
VQCCCASLIKILKEFPMHHRRIGLLLLATLPFMLLSATTAPAQSGDTLITVGSPPSPFAQNKQNEPAIAVNANDPSILVAGANDEIDLEACNAGNPTTCPFTTGVGLSGIYFSFDGGATWRQPTYSGWTARDCLGPAPCVPHVGPIGTLPNYFENGLVSDGDPSLAFGPKPDSTGKFSWANGARLYYGNLASNFSSLRSEAAFKGFEAVAVSYTDNPQAAAAGDATAWSNPVIATRQNAALFSDKDDIWADNAASSPFFGNVYLCNAAFRGQEISPFALPEPIVFVRSTDGGVTWTNERQLSSATNNIVTQGRQDCAVRTDSAGVVYVYWDGFDIRTRQNVMFQVRSFDGGLTFQRPPQVVATFIPVGIFDPATGRFSFDGIAGARTATAPSVDIANGAPTGTDATDEIVLAWSNGPTPSATSPGPDEQALVQFSINKGVTWSTPVNAAAITDRPDFPAVAISPNGTDLYLTYDSFLQPWQNNTSTARLMRGVVRHADIGTGGAPGSWGDLHRGAIGDSRGSSQNGLTAGFLGDYNYAAATRTFGAAVWNDVRNAADCSAIDAFRFAFVQFVLGLGPAPTPPAPNSDCPVTFGNSDIFGNAFPDPTP